MTVKELLEYSLAIGLGLIIIGSAIAVLVILYQMVKSTSNFDKDYRNRYKDLN